VQRFECVVVMLPYLSRRVRIDADEDAAPCRVDDDAVLFLRRHALAECAV